MGSLSQKCGRAIFESRGVCLDGNPDRFVTVSRSNRYFSMLPYNHGFRTTGEAAIDPDSRITSMTPRLLLAVVWLLSAFYVGKELRRGWFPQDEGVLAQSAERVLRGELPHRDFDELYTGGLSYLNAGAFRVFGTNLASMRFVLYFFFLAWVPCLYFTASRFGPPWVAASFTLLAVVWSVPNYSTAMPSWYNLFFATFGAAALLCHVETKKHRWLFIAGLCGGVSFLFKLSGLYFVAGSVLFLLFLPGKSLARIIPLERWCCMSLAASCVLAYEVSVFSLLRKVFSWGSFPYFFLPILAVGTAVLLERLRSPHQNDEFRSVVTSLLLFGAGVAVPVLLFLIPYMRSAAVADFMRGVFVLPGKRLQFTVRTQSLRRFLAGTTADIVVLIMVFRTPRKMRAATSILLLATAVGVAVGAREHPALYDAAWVPIWNMLPVVVVGGILLLMTTAGNIQPERRQKIFLLLTISAACNLIQFPYSAPIYFCYVAPLLALCVLAVETLLDATARLVLAGFFCICLLYAVFDVTPRFLSNRGELYAPQGRSSEVVLPRIGGLHLYGADAKQRGELVRIIEQHARGTYIYATPDCPEVYFLSGFRNPTRTLFDFLDEQPGRTQRILSAIRDREVNLVVINLAPSFSGPVPQDLREALEVEFPEQSHLPNYEVRWKR